MNQAMYLTLYMYLLSNLNLKKKILANLIDIYKVKNFKYYSLILPPSHEI